VTGLFGATRLRTRSPVGQRERLVDGHRVAALDRATAPGGDDPVLESGGRLDPGRLRDGVRRLGSGARGSRRGEQREREEATHGRVLH
jgi:hypothetical protein